MKAWVLHGINDFRYEEVKEPLPEKDEVLVEVRAVGVCGSDIPRVYKDGAHQMPLIIGHEFAGQVAETGKRVGVFPLIPCGKCMPCKKKQYEMCRNYSYLGSRRNGAFAQYVAVPKWNLIELPETVSFEEAAMLEPMAVAVHAMRRLHPKKTDTVVVCGLGTIGMLLVLFLIEAGIENILVVGNKEFQKQTIEKLGLPESHYCDSKNTDVSHWIMEKTDGMGADVFFECVGKEETVTQAVNLTAPAGKICLVGNPYSDMKFDKATYWKILRNQLEVTGTWNSSFTHEENDDWHYVLKKLAQKKINPSQLISHRYDLEEIDKGLHIMRDKTEDYLKIIAKI